MSAANYDEVTSCLSLLKEENGLSKKCREKIEQIIFLLQEDSQLVVEKALIILEELSSLEMSSYHKTQIWEVASMLESKLVKS